MDVRLIALLFFLVGCMPSATVSRGNLTDEATTTAGSGDGSGEEPATLTEVSWKYLGSTNLSIAIDAANRDTAFIVGTEVDNFLKSTANFSDINYCVSANFSQSNVIYDLRARAVPYSYYDFTKKKTIRVLRVDFPNADSSNDLCSGTLFVPGTDGVLVADSSSALAPVFEPVNLCPTCSSSLSSSRVRLFRRDTTLTQVPSSGISTTGLALDVNPNNTSTNNPGSCTTSSCAARGYDCCLENQCVNEGSTRPTAFTQFEELLRIANLERETDRMSYLKYPQLYYICGTTPSTTSGSDGGGDGTEYDAGLLQLKKDYVCLQNLKAQATVSPFNKEFLTRTNWLGSTDCLTNATTQWSLPQFYRTVLKRLYDSCECNMNLTLDERIRTCPAYEYEVTEGTEALPLEITCKTPESDGTAQLPTQLTVNVSTRAAPHRYFDKSGTERFLPLTDSSVEQEGDTFEYEDSENVFPKQSNFSMNAVLGQMSIALDKTQPAKQIDVAIDQVYYIAARSGNYTPCPQCGEDSWQLAFNAYPSTSNGTGLQAAGHTTSRDEFSTNTTRGNYEDTIFGRACWIPPTMLPFSQSVKTSASTQRENRLRTQAALFVNGYQRDWFGFNKGALIGSFDGVSWFAIGNGRIVKSRSKKLFLAINAPFADVANNSSLSVNVQAYDGTTQAAQVDYDPQYHQYHPLQNQGGNCQSYHMCSTDSDCVTKLGWEYACADVKSTKTNWPVFDSEATEQAANISPAPSIVDVLAQRTYPSSATKRCVYRGAGSLCLRSAGAVTDLNKKKVLTCAPNFYCANLSTTQFNSKVARYAATLDDIPVGRNHIFGKDANVLGRPLNYIPGSDPANALTSVITSALLENMALNLPGQEGLATLSNTGLCQPGKMLPTTVSDQISMANPFNQHLAADPSKRTDYISQVGSCNSVLFTSYRHSSCPTLGTDGNYQMFAATTVADTLAYSKVSSNQNACGLETLLTGTSLSGTADTIATNGSPFKTIEGKVLSNQVIVEETLARDACLRRANAVCHTDLDCSPNKFHSDQEDSYGVNYFGNLAEKEYYDQFLICGQTDPKPNINDTNYDTYDMTKNRCCREVGSPLTTYTPYTPTSVQILSYDPVTFGLKSTLTPGVSPTDPKRYSRFATVENLNTTERPVLSSYQERNATTGVIANDPFGSNVLKSKQWKTLNETNSETCCGGGWIREFASGQSWSDRNLLSIDVTNFRCLNSRTSLITNPTDFDDINPDPLVVDPLYGATNTSSYVDADYGDYCKDIVGTKGACAQWTFRDSLTDTAPVLNAYDATVVLNTLSPFFGSGNLDNYFAPRSNDANSAIFIDYSNATGRRNINIKIPSFVTKRDFDDVYSVDPNTLPIAMVSSTGLPVIGSCSYADLSLLSGPTDNGSALCASGCCVDFNLTTRVLKVVFNDAALITQQVGIAISVASAGSLAGINRTIPGFSSYYLRRLGRLELSGVPQIVHEPLYCNDNSDRLVPGLYSTSVSTRDDFEDPAFSFNNGTNFYTSFKGLQTQQVFSPSEFKCCSPLGKTVGEASKCCSGFVTTSGTTNTCSLPPGADLMVYFNRFISNEGVGTDRPGGGLVETDFDQTTGEPLITAAINSKITELGKAYCSSKKVRQGGAFGAFEPQPQGNDTVLSARNYGIVDSSNDNGQVSSAGATVSVGSTVFGPEFGFRWNHHLYCND